MNIKKILAIFLVAICLSGTAGAFAATYSVTFHYGVTATPTAYKSTNGYIRDTNSYCFVVEDGQTWDVNYQGSAWVGGYPDGERIGSYQVRQSGTTYSYTENGVSGYGQLRFDNEYWEDYTEYASGTIS